MKTFYPILIMLISAISSTAQSKKVFKEDKAESKMADMIARLPEVIKADAFCKKKSRGKRHLETFVADGPGAENGNYYHVEVVEDNGMALHIWYNFLVNADTKKIYYQDNSNDINILLSTWRRQKNYLGLN